MTPPNRMRSTSSLGLIIFGVIFAGFACFWMAIAGLVAGDPIMLLFGLPFLLIGGGILAYGLRSRVAAMRIGQPELTISNTTLRVGDPFTVMHQQTFRSSGNLTGIQVRLLLRESATYRRGTDTVTVTHDHEVQKLDLPPMTFSSGQLFAQNYQLQIPARAMHTFEANRNKLRWYVKVHIGLAGWPDFDEEYEVKVLPEGGVRP